jgi:hypothetical protein
MIVKTGLLFVATARADADSPRKRHGPMARPVL